MTRALVVVAALLWASGCDDGSAPSPRTPRTAVPQSTRENLDAAMEYLERANEFEESQSSFQVAYCLNRWLDGQSLRGDWQPDPLLERLPREIRGHAALQDLGRLRFHVEDAKPLQQSVWLRQISRWAAQRPADPSAEAWVTEREPELGRFEADQLRITLRLFDWTIRHIQLDELIPYPAETVAQPRPKPGEAVAPLDPPPLRGIPGPGYSLHPWQTLLYGHGDAWQRARVFILLCRQQGMDVAMLAFPAQTIPPRPRPWLPAVLVKDDLYLFDAAWGLPIAGRDRRGIATLAQVLEDPGLLQAMAAGSDRPYPVEAADLKSILALLDISPADVSRRMSVVEEHLTGDHRTVLTASPARLAARLRACRGIHEVALWSLPFEAIWYQAALEKKMADEPQAAAQQFVERAVFSGRNALVQGRCLHFRGILENQGEKKGAIALYMEARVPQAQIDGLTTSEEVQRQLGLTRDRDEGNVLWSRRVASFKIVLSQAKERATYWLGLAQYDAGRYEAAIEWLERRTLEAMPNGPWTNGARYNLGRAYEALGDSERARAWYRADKSSPQRDGNLWRASRLEQRLPEAKQGKPERASPLSGRLSPGE